MPNPAVGAVGASVVSGVFGSKQTGDAAQTAADAQAKASERAIDESARQFDTVREDTRVSRETGDQAMIALGYLMGTRKPPTQEDLGAKRSELEGLQGELEQINAQLEQRRQEQDDRYDVDMNYNPLEGPDAMKEGTDPVGVTLHPGQSPGEYWLGSGAAGQDRGQIGDLVQRRNEIQRQISSTQTQMESMEMEADMAGELGAIGTDVPDLNSLFDNVDMPTGENIGDPDAYLPDLDNFLKGLGEDLKKSEGYQFELEQGREALKNAQAAKGTAYGGNALRAAIEHGQDYASTKYGERHGQALQAYDRKYQEGMTRYGMDVDEYNRQRQEGLDQYGMNLDQYNLAKREEQDQYSRLFTMAGYGPAGAQTSAGAGRDYASTVGQASQNYANTVGQGAYNQAAANIQGANNVANTAMTMYQYNEMMDQMRA